MRARFYSRRSFYGGRRKNEGKKYSLKENALKLLVGHIDKYCVIA
jgi:hypothetical protein